MHLQLYPWANRIEDLTKISAKETLLSLGTIGLGRKNNLEVTQVLAAIPPHVINLDLRSNGLSKRSGSELSQNFTALTNITSLDLRWNNLGSKRGNELAQAFTALRATALGLSGNNLYKRNGAELAQAFSAIPANVTSLDLSFNKFHKISENQLILMKDSLKHVLTLRLDYRSLELMSEDQQVALRNVFPNIQNITLLDDWGKEITPTVQMSNIVIKLGGKTQVSSLINQCSFFAQNKMGIDLVPPDVPIDLIKQIEGFNWS